MVVLWGKLFQCDHPADRVFVIFLRQISKDPQMDMFQIELNRIVDSRHPLVKLAHKMDWTTLDREFETHFSDEGRPAIPTRLMIALHYLKYTYDLSDDETLAHCERVSVDTTVQTKDVRFPTDARLYDRMREVLVRGAGGTVNRNKNSTRCLRSWLSRTRRHDNGRFDCSSTEKSCDPDDTPMVAPA